MSDIGEFCEGIPIKGFTYQVIGRAPIRQNSDIARNYARHAVQIKERTKSARDLLRKAAQGITAKLRPGNVPVVEIGGTLDARNEVRDNRTFERNRDYVLPPGVMQAQQEDHYMVIAKYHVTLVAQANRTIKVLSTSALAAGGIGAAGGGVTGAAAGAGAGATAGTCTCTVVSWVSVHGPLNITRDFGPHERLPGIKISYICIEAATLTP